MKFYFKKNVLDFYKDYSFNHYHSFSIKIDMEETDKSDIKFVNIFKDMYSKFLEEGGTHIPGAELQFDGAILLENQDSIIGGIYYNLQRSLSNVYVVLAFTEKEYRRQGIYKKFHNLIDVIGKEHGKIGVSSFMGVNDKRMIYDIASTVGYRPYYLVVHRTIKK